MKKIYGLSDKCPLCKDAVEDNLKHVITCGMKTNKTIWGLCKHLLMRSGTSIPECKIIQMFIKDEGLELLETESVERQIVLHQNQIGYNEFINGIWAEKWTEMHNKIKNNTDCNKMNENTKWENGVVKALQDMAHKFWETRNSALHDTNDTKNECKSRWLTILEKESENIKDDVRSEDKWVGEKFGKKVKINPV